MLAVAGILRRLAPRDLAASTCMTSASRSSSPAPEQRLPLPPPPGMSVQTEEYLVFDPTLSFNYELSIVPDIPFKGKDDEREESQWPPETLN